MNPKDFFEITHYRLTPIDIIEPFDKNISMYNGQTFTIQSALNQKNHPLTRQTAELIYYIHQDKLYQVGKKEMQQGIAYVGYSVYYLTHIKYKGLYDIDNLSVETLLELFKKKKAYKILSQTSFDNIKDGSETLIYNQSKLEEPDEYCLSYMIIYRNQSQGQQIQEQVRLEKKEVYQFKALQPFESHYSMIPEKVILTFQYSSKYQCQNISTLKIDFSNIEFKVDKLMEIEKLFEHPLPLVLEPEECYKIIYRIKISTLDRRQLMSVLTQKKDPTEFDLRLGHIYLEWGECGRYSGSQKNCMVRLNPVIMRIERQIEIPRETITELDIVVELGFYYPNTELVIKLDEMEMKAIQIVGMSQMRIQFDDENRSRSMKLEIIGSIGGLHQVKGLKIIDSKAQRQLPFKNNMSVCVINKQKSDMSQSQQLQQQQIQQQQQYFDLLDLDLNVNVKQQELDLM